MKKLDSILGIRYPIIQGAMGGISGGKFAADCSNAGILGTIASGGLSCEELEKEIELCRKNTDFPFAVNIVMNHAELYNVLELTVSLDVPIVILGNGNAVKVIEYLKYQGKTVIPILSSPEFAKFYQRAGADVIIAEGCESGGHIGRLTTMVLVPQICDACDLPVIAAGGIADHRQFRAALALGACGVQIGTALLASRECPIHEEYKKIIIRSKSSSSVVTGHILGDEVRTIRNALTDEYFELEKKGDVNTIKSLLEGSLSRAVRDGDMERGSFMAGQVCGQIRSIRPLIEIIKDIFYGD